MQAIQRCPESGPKGSGRYLLLSDNSKWRIQTGSGRIFGYFKA